MLRSIVSSIEFEKFRRNWSEKNSMKRFLRKRFRSFEVTQRLASIGARQVVSHFNYEICERFAPIFLRRTHVKL
ncbi:hypothetical protein [Leptospira noguchii]|uniref:Uncharacterized protein n=1 Tax=Leptospira noguchii TaxID=28182 RepID=A0AAE9GEQ3_9LEPT|nr:hypothetical protein [Leptospira noguchii]UOG54628.1 hypothetical protein MAL09_20525 [Leptospira noguchii]UOG58641.1 hypothetical protein MAL03_18435 [Leptospira noguchii]